MSCMKSTVRTKPLQSIPLGDMPAHRYGKPFIVNAVARMAEGLFPDLYIGFSRSRSGGLVVPSLSEFSTVIVIHTVKGFGIVNKAEIDVFLELSCFSMIQRMLAI